MQPIKYSEFLNNLYNPANPVNNETVKDTYYARALFAQYLHETGKGTSRIYKEFINLFGMRPSAKRQKFYVSKSSTATGEYAVYDTPLASIADREDLDNYNNIAKPTSHSEVLPYYMAVKAKGYATDPTYVAKVNRVYEEAFPNTALGGVTPISNNSNIETTGNNSTIVTKSIGKLPFPIMAIIGAILGFVSFKLYKKFKK